MRDTVAPTLLPEWAPQSGVLLTWPHAGSDWHGRLEAIEVEYTTLARAIAEHEPVVVACRDALHLEEVRGRLAAAGLPAARTRLHVAPSDDTWVRDYGPLAVGHDGRVELIDFAFNAWGGKYPHDRDAAFTRVLHAGGALGDIPLRHEALVVEGGALESDGHGTLLTTTNCLDLPSRNPGLDRTEVGARLASVLGARRVHWLEAEPLPGDDTDGHVDTLVRFCDPATLAHCVCDNRHDTLHAPLAALEQQLRELRRPDGRPYRLVPLPLPGVQQAADGRSLPATYANFLIVNGAVLCPRYHDPVDDVASDRLAAAFPGRVVIGVPARTLIEENGSLHCATMQLPTALEPDLPEDR
jgi:agmatine/peptidylarginine deiminase